LFIKTLFSKIIFAFFLLLTAILLPSFLYVETYTYEVFSKNIWAFIIWSIFTVTTFALFIRQLIKPLHCLINVCNQQPSNLIDSFSCFGSSEVLELSDAITTLIQSHQHLCDQKQDIFKEAAHELKSPIAILKARIALFEQHHESDKALFIKEAKEDIQNITLKLKELLFLKEVEWGMQQSKEHFFIQDQCDMMREAFAPILEKKGLSIINSSSEDFHLYVHKNALAKVMQAIFENIFFHTKNNTTIKTTVNSQERSLEITNIRGDKGDETLFSSSIGMQIIKRISEKLNYRYHTQELDDLYITTITFL